MRNFNNGSVTYGGNGATAAPSFANTSGAGDRPTITAAKYGEKKNNSEKNVTSGYKHSYTDRLKYHLNHTKHHGDLTDNLVNEFSHGLSLGHFRIRSNNRYAATKLSTQLEMRRADRFTKGTLT